MKVKSGLVMMPGILLLMLMLSGVVWAKKEVKRFANGKVSSITHYKHGDKHGLYTRYSRLGHKEVTIDYWKGHVHGKQTRYYMNGKPKNVFTFVKDKQTGPYFHYSSEGKVCEKGNLLNGRKHGLVERYDCKGVLTSKITYSNGYVSGVAKYYKKGKLSSEQHYKKSKRSFGFVLVREKEWDKNGKLSKDVEKFPDGSVKKRHK